MNPLRSAAILVAVSVLAGGGDLATGLFLVVDPRRTLLLMGAGVARDPVFVQFVGIFVGCVGASYGLGLLSWRLRRNWVRLRVVWELTILFRLAAGVFVAVEVASGHLVMAWLSVPAVDWAWALTQAFLLRQGVFEKASG